MDVIGLISAPGKSHLAADVLGQETLAYGAGTAVVVTEVRGMHVACTLYGGHKAPVTAVKWCPAHHSRDFKETSQLRLASGDSSRGVVVWDVFTASPVARLEDVHAARELLKEYAGRVASNGNALAAGTTSTGDASSIGVASLAWVLPNFSMLAVVMSPGLLMLWDVAGSAVVWRRELSSSGSELFTQMAVAPLDNRQLCMCGSNGALVVLHLADPARNKVQMQQYRVDMKGNGYSKVSASGGSLQALFAMSPGLLVLLLSRELVVFDLDLGQPAASSPLPAGLAPFAHLLGAFGGGFCQGDGVEGGLDFVYCTHTDGSLSLWARVPGELRFKLSNTTQLIPTHVKGAHSQVTFSVVKACLSYQLQQQDPQTAQTAASTSAITQKLSASLAAMHVTCDGAAAQATAATCRDGGSGASGAVAGRVATLSKRSFLVLGVTTDGRLWQWRMALPHNGQTNFATSPDAQPTALGARTQAAGVSYVPATVTPQLIGLLHGLRGGISAVAMHLQPILLSPHPPILGSSVSSQLMHGSSATTCSSSPATAHELPAVTQIHDQKTATDDDASACAGSAQFQEPRVTAVAAATEACAVLGAAATSTGHVEVLCIRRGSISPLAVEVSRSINVHREVVKGIRWVGSTPQLVTFSSDKTSSGAWKNSLAITDVRTGRSLPFRDTVGNEGSPMLGIRVSPSGTYLLLLLKGAPCELWTTAARESLTSAVPAAAAAVHSGAPGAIKSAVASQQNHCSLSKPWRVRLLDLPFSAVEWVEDMQQDMVDAWAAAPNLISRSAGDEAALTGADVAPAESLQSPPDTSDIQHAPRSTHFSRTLSALSSPSMVAAGDAATATSDASLPAELLAFGLTDGRSGVLSVRGRKVTDTRPRRPSSSPAPGDSVASALAFVWPLLVLGDADGTLMTWDVITGRCSSLATGAGVIRRIHLAPARPPVLSGAVNEASAGTTAINSTGSNGLRLAVLYSGGHFEVYEVDAAGRILQTPACSGAGIHVGKALDVSWVNMPGSTGAGNVLSVVLEDGSLCLVNVAQSQVSRTNTSQRQAQLQQALHTPSPAQIRCGLTGVCSTSSVPVVLMPPRPLRSPTLLQHSWVMLLRLLLQAGISREALIRVGSCSTSQDEEVRRELLMMMPQPARDLSAHTAAQTTATPVDLQHEQASVVDRAKPSPLLRVDSDAPVSALAMQSSSAKLWAGMQQQQEVDIAANSAGRNPHNNAHSPYIGSDLVQLLRHIAAVRGNVRLLDADEWHAYSKALSSGLVAPRMAVAAHMSGHQDEACFWSALPATLESVKVLQTAIQQQQEAACGAPFTAADENSSPRHSTADELDIDTVADYDRMVQQAVEAQETAPGFSGSSRCVGIPKAESTPAGGAYSPAVVRTKSGAVPGRVRCSAGCQQLMTEGLGALKIAAAGRAVRLWDEQLVLSHAQERLRWHEALPSQVFEAESMLEHRLLQYVVLGDFATAVAFLLSMPPESSVSYYRSLVCALALAATASLRAQSTESNTNTQAAATLHLQAAKVVSAHALSIGDNLLGVPLNCSAGLDADAVTLLQEAGMWQHAAVLTARALTGSQRTQALCRWGSHMLRQEGSVWRCVGILTTAGCLSAAAQVLCDMQLPDCAQAYVQSCQQAGLLKAPPETARSPQQQTEPALELKPQVGQQASHGCISGLDSSNEMEHSIGHSDKQSKAELFDLLSQRTRLVSLNNVSSCRQLNGSDVPGIWSGSEQLRFIAKNYDSYLRTLISEIP